MKGKGNQWLFGLRKPGRRLRWWEIAIRADCDEAIDQFNAELEEDGITAVYRQNISEVGNG